MAENATKSSVGGPHSSDGGKVFDRKSDYGYNDDSKPLTAEGGGYADGTTYGVNPDTTPRVKHP